MWVNELSDIGFHIDTSSLATAVNEYTIFKDIGAVTVYGGSKSFLLCHTVETKYQLILSPLPLTPRQ
jgi:hypothetical protein